MTHPFIAPQLAKSTATLPSGSGWLYQEKFDGHRIQASVCNGEVRMQSRNGHDRTDLFASLAPDFKRLSADLILDGEICALDENGRSDFSRLGAALSRGGPFHLFAFDLLALDGRTLVGEALSDRLDRLRQVLATAGPSISVAECTTEGETLLVSVRERHGEGIVAKRVCAPYLPGTRSDDWLKIKLRRRQEFAVAGWHEDANGMLQSLVLATSSADGVTFRGCVGTGFSVAQRAELRDNLSARQTEQPPFARTGGIRGDVKWSSHWLVVEVEYGEITATGSVRHPRFLGVRHDKEAGEVILEP